jgi:hypothetical protein
MEALKNFLKKEQEETRRFIPANSKFAVIVKKKMADQEYEKVGGKLKLKFRNGG